MSEFEQQDVWYCPVCGNVEIDKPECGCPECGNCQLVKKKAWFSIYDDEVCFNSIHEAIEYQKQMKEPVIWYKQEAKIK